MASAVLGIYRQRLHELDPDVHLPGEERRRAQRAVYAFSTTDRKVVTSIRESRDLQESRRPAIVVSSSGMATGGRVLHHLASALPDARNTVFFVGYQAAGTRGRQLCDGARFTKIHGREVPVLAHIERMDAMSAHADANEIMRWLSNFKTPPTLTCLVHGEPEPMDALKGRIERELGWTVRAPGHQEKLLI